MNQLIRASVEGATTVRVSGRTVPLSTAERQVMAALLLDPSTGVSIRTLETLRWGDDPPRTARQSLQNTVSRLRAKLSADIDLAFDRYRLVTAVETDEDRLVRLATALEGGMPADVADLPGVPEWFADLPVMHETRRAAERLDTLLRRCTVARIVALEAAGAVTEALSLAHELRAADPSDESSWVREIDLHLRVGRRLEASATYRRARRELRHHWGIEPGPDLRRVEQRIFQATTTPTVDTSVPLVGRLDEQQRIQRHLTAGRTVLLHGARWSGKTRLATAVADRWPVTATVVDCGRSRRTPLAAVEDVTGDPVRLTDRIEARELLSRMVDRVRSTLDDTGLLVLDDVDRLGPLSREVFARALRNADTRVLATCRQRGGAVPGRDDVVEVALSGLGLEEIGRLVSVDQDAARILDQLTGGSPGLLLLLVEATGRTGVDLRMLDRLVTAERVPPPIADALLSRIAGVPPHVLAMLESVATAGATGVPFIDRLALDEGAPGVVRMDGAARPVFCHPLFRRVIVDRLPEGLRREVDLLQVAEPAVPAFATA